MKHLIALIFLLALCLSAFGQDTLDLTKFTDAGQISGSRTRTVAAGTRLDVASGVVWLPWSLRMGDRIDMDILVGYGESREGVAVGNNRITANRYQEWLKPWTAPGYWTTLSIGASGISEGGEVVAGYSPIQSASVGLWVDSDNAASALIIRSATYYEMRPTNTPTFTPSPTETETPSPTAAATFTPTADWRPDPSEIPGAERVHRMEVESGTGPRWINVWELWRVE